jgi:hypothetical protein
VQPAADEHKQIGALFLEKGLISEGDLEEALAEQRRNGGRLGEILVAQGAITRLDLASAIGAQWGKSVTTRGSRHQTFELAAPPKAEPAGDANDAEPVALSLVPTATPAPEEPTAEPAEDEALRIARRRYALGELTREEYLELAADLSA